MKREEIADRIRESIIDEDKELIVKTYRSIADNIAKFHLSDIGLKGKYTDLSYRYLPGKDKGIESTYKGYTLRITLDQVNHKISVNKDPKDGDNILIDEIIAKNNKLTCYDGEFKIEELNDYIAKCFAHLLHT